MRVTIMCLFHLLLIKRNYVISDCRNFLFHSDQNTTYFLLTALYRQKLETVTSFKYLITEVPYN